MNVEAQGLRGFIAQRPWSAVLALNSSQEQDHPSSLRNCIPRTPTIAFHTFSMVTISSPEEVLAKRHHIFKVV